MIFFPYPQNVGRRSYRGTPPETPPIAGPDIRIQTDGERQKLPKSMSDQRAEWDINICLYHKLYQRNLDIKI